MRAECKLNEVFIFMKQKEFFMKRLINYLFAIGLIGCSMQTLPMIHNLFGNMPIQDVINQMGNGFQNVINRADVLFGQQRLEQQIERQRLVAILNDPTATQEARAMARDSLNRLEQQTADLNNLAQNAAQRGLEVAGDIFGLPGRIVEQQVRDQGELQRAALNADANRQASIANHRATLDWIKQPRNLATVAGGVGLTVFAGYGAYQALKLGAEMIQHMYRNPTLAQETSLLSLQEKIAQAFLGKKVYPDKLSDVVMSPEVEKQMSVIDKALKNAVETDDLLFNVLLWGEPGTGKTMMAQRLARSSGLHFIRFSGSSLDQFSLEEALIKLRELFEYPEKTGQKMVIVIDEVERLLAKRTPNMSEKTAKMLTDILTYLGTESSDYMVIALTNRPEDLDEAFLSRCDYQIYIGSPDQEQRSRIVKKYATDYLLNTPASMRVPSLFVRLKNKIFKPKPQPRIAIAPDAMSEEMIADIARRTEGFVGRDLSKMIFEMRRKASVSANKTLTKEMVNEVVNRKVQEHAQKQGGFKREKQAQRIVKVAPANRQTQKPVAKKAAQGRKPRKI